MAFARGLRRLPALSWLKVCTERANKTQGQELYDRMSRTEEAFGANVAFRGLAFNPYLSLSLRPSLPSTFNQSSQIISRRTDGREVGGQLRCKHRRIPVCSLLWKPSHVQTRTQCQKYLRRDDGSTVSVFIGERNIGC